MHGYNDLDIVKPKSATKVFKKRGRKGDQTQKAFQNIPTTPVNAEEYAKSYGISTATLRQIKRHDSFKETGKVFVRKSKSGNMMVWRDLNIKPAAVKKS